MIFLRFFLLFSFLFSLNNANAHKEKRLRLLYSQCGLSNKEINARLKIINNLTKETSRKEFLASIQRLKPCDKCEVCSKEILRSTFRKREEIYKFFSKQLEKSCKCHAKKLLVKNKNKKSFALELDYFDDEEEQELQDQLNKHKKKFKSSMGQIKFKRNFEKYEKKFVKDSMEIQEELDKIEKYELKALRKLVKLGGSFSYTVDAFSYEELQSCSLLFEDLKATSLWEDERYKNYCNEYELSFIEDFLANAERLLQEFADSSSSDYEDLPLLLSSEEESEEIKENSINYSEESEGEEPVNPKSLGCRKFKSKHRF